VKRVILEKWKHKTVVAVVHHLSTILDYDMVVVIDAGHVVEQGNPKDLLLRDSGWFKNLWDANI